MKTLYNIQKTSLLAITLLVSFSACSAVNNDVESITDEDIDMAAQVVSSALADDESGMISSMYDAFSDINNSGISYGYGSSTGPAKTTSPEADRPRHGRGFEKDFTHTYDSTTGVHTLSFDRVIELSDFSKSIEVYREIVYTDLDGNFIATPHQNKNNIEAISFFGTAIGSSEGLFRSSSFTKEDHFELEGMHETSPVLTMSGTHSGSGQAEGLTRDTLTASRSYNVEITFENVAINKDTVQAYGNLENGISGTLSYSVTLSKTIDGVPEQTVLEGTIDLEEDGTALMRFKELPQVIRFSLKSGDYRQENQTR